MSPSPERRLPGYFVVLLALVLLQGTGGCSKEQTPLDSFATPGSADASAVAYETTAVHQAPSGNKAALESWRRVRTAWLKQRYRLRDSNGFSTQVHSRTILDGPTDLRREFLLIDSPDGSRIPAIIQTPLEVTPKAIVLVFPGHVNEQDSGLRQLVHDESSYHNAAATAIARAGYITVAFELRGFGLLGPPLETEHRHVAHNALLTGSFYKSLIIDDARATLAVLDSVIADPLPPLAVAGASLGGELATTFGVLEPRVRAVAYSSYGGHAGPFRFAAGTAADQRHYCHLIPGAASNLRREDVELLLAPRPTLGVRGALDYDADGQFVSLAQSVWALSGNDAAVFRFEIVPERKHEFFVDETVAFLDGVFDER